MSSPPLGVIIADTDPLARQRVRDLLAQEKSFRLLAEASNGPETIALARHHHPDILLLETELPGLDGFQVVSALGEEAPAIVFLSAKSSDALRAFEAQASDYVLKPFSRDRFREALARARLLRSAARPQKGKPASIPIDRIILKAGRRRVVVALSDIQYALAENASCKVFTTSGTLSVNESLGALEGRLETQRFIRISRFALVNLAYVAALEPKTHGDQFLVLKTGTRLVVSRTRRHRLVRSLEPI
jgi:two-component system LytT family response regulator